MSAYTTTTRPLTLLYQPTTTTTTRTVIPVPSTAQEWIAAEVNRDSFYDLLVQLQADGKLIGLFDVVESFEDEKDPAGAKKADEREKELVLLGLFLNALTDKVAKVDPKGDQGTRESTGKILWASFNHLFSEFLVVADPGATNPPTKSVNTTDVHSLVAELTTPIKNLVLSSYYAAKTVLVQLGYGNEIIAKEGQSLLLSSALAGDSELYALFGGQGMNEVYFDELATLYTLYSPLLVPFLTLASAHLTQLCTASGSPHLFTPHSLSFLNWLQDPSSRPPVSYLASCAVSLPLIGLTQLAQYVVLGKGSNLGPAELGAFFKGATGHSQGVVSAAVIARKYTPGGDWTEFYEHALHGLTVLFQIGLQGSLAFPPLSLPQSIVQSAVENGEGVPTPMLAVTGLEKAALEKKIKEVNDHLVSVGKDASVKISLNNGARAFAVTGVPRDLVGLTERLRKGRAPSGKDQSKIPHSKRLPVFSMRFLPIGVPYHSHLLSGASAAALSSISSTDSAFWSPSDLTLAVYNTETGADLRLSGEGSLLPSLLHLILDSPINWNEKATAFPESATHAIDFGTGGQSGIGSLCVRNWEGRGIRTVMLGNRNGGTGAGREVWASDRRGMVGREERWSTKFGPRLVKGGKGKVEIDTRFSRLLNKPPLMVAGMTPCTVQAGFVSAVLRAGYHVELAGGGHYNAKALRSKVDQIQKEVDMPGVGITLNSLYINQRQWTFQLPLWCEMKKEGLPIEGLTVAAGIPSTDKAKEIIDSLREAGVKHVSFKPGSVAGIRQVINIATIAPDFPIILQWTGGRAGGHHSCEDFHAPILATYTSIRAQANIVLVAGSGFGSPDAEDTYPYLSGVWSKKYGAQRMPFDGFLFASRVMVAKEAHTSEAIKKLIVDAKGVDDSQWESTYDKPTGGIMTVTSELGEPIHKVATRGVKLWGEFDKTVFALPREKQAAWLADHKQYVIDRLNADFQKPWFPAKADGSTCDLDDMTYSEVNARLVRLMYVSHQKRWIDPSLRNLVGDWIRRVEERLSNVNAGNVKISVLQSYSQLDEPEEFLVKFEETYKEAREQVLASADVAYFLAITQRPGQKPVPFIPVLDASFSIWFKKDSLWQCDDVEAVFDQDPQRTCILQGPVAVKYCTETQQPIKELLGGIEAALAKKLLDEYYGGDESKIPSIDYLAPNPAPIDPTLLDRHHISYRTEEIKETGGVKHVYDINGVLPPTGDWLNTLAGPKLNWLQAFLSNVSITHGKQTLPNPVKRVLAPRHGQRVELSLAKDGSPEKLQVFGGL